MIHVWVIFHLICYLYFFCFLEVFLFVEDDWVYFGYFVLTERNPPIEEVIQSGVVPRLVEFLARDDYPQLQV